MISRDLQQFAGIQRRHVLPRLLELVAGRSGTPLVADLADSLAVSAVTVRNYLSYLDTVFLVSQLRAWSSSNLTHRVTLDVEISHYRDRDGCEIDFVLEARDGRVAAIEVKSSLSPASTTPDTCDGCAGNQAR